MEGLKPEEKEGMVTNWEGKEMEELLEAFRTKVEPSEKHVHCADNQTLPTEKGRAVSTSKG